MSGYADLVPGSKRSAYADLIDTKGTVQRGLAETAEAEPNPNLVEIGSRLSAIPEAVQQIAGHMTGKGKEADATVAGRREAMGALEQQHPLTRPVGALTDVASAGVLPGLSMKALPFLKSLSAPAQRIAQGVGTGATYGALTPTSGKGNFGREKIGQVASGGAAGALLSSAAEIATRDPKLLRDAPAAAEHVLEGTKSKLYERTKTDFDARMKPLREEAFKSGSVDPSDTVSVLEGLKAKNPDPKVRAALDETAKTIKNALSSSKAGALPASGSRVSAADLKAAKTRGNQLSVEMADEVRQSINRQIEQKGDNALDGHTKDLLAQVRNHLVGKTPKEYRDYLEQYQKGAKDLKRFEVADQILPTNLSGEVDISNAANRWNKMRDDIKEKGVFSDKHYAAIDKVMTDLSKREEGAHGLKSMGSSLGYLIGGYHTAIGVRTAVGAATGTTKTPKQIGQLVEKVLSDEGAAAAAAAPPTPENIKRLQDFMAIAGSREEAKPKAPTPRRPNVLSMRPAGL